MIVRCSNCSAAFAVDDEKVQDKKFAFNCPKCEHENIIDNRREGEPVHVESLEKGEYGKAEGYPAESHALQFRETPSDQMVEQEAEEPVNEEVSGEEIGDLLGDQSLMEDEEPGDEAFEKYEEEEFSPEAEEPVTGELEPEEDLSEADLETDFSEEEETLPVKDDEDLDAEAGEETFGEEELFDVDVDDLNLDIDEAPGEAEEPETEEKESVHKAETSEEDFDLPDEIDIDEVFENDESGKIEKQVRAKREDESGLMADDSPIIDELEEESFEDVPVYDSGDDVELTEDESETVISDDYEDETVSHENVEGYDSKTEDDITIDLDSLDIDLEEDDTPKVGEAHEEDLDGIEESQEVEEIDLPIEEEEDVTLDLDSLDIDLEEDEEIRMGEQPDEDSEQPEKAEPWESSDEEDITLDLESLDIDLEEDEEIKQGEDLDEEDEKLNLTLEDAGLTMDDIDEHLIYSKSEEPDEEDEEDLKLTIEELDPSIDMDQLTSEIDEAEEILNSTGEEDDHLIIDEVDELPEIDLGEDVDELAVYDEDKEDIVVPGMEMDRVVESVEYSGSRSYEDLDLEPVDDRLSASGTTGERGTTFFSIDYSLKNSRLGALFRVIPIVQTLLVPHFIVAFVYNILSAILGFLNQLIVIGRGETMEDFSAILENTLRYQSTIMAYTLGIVEEYPVFTGKPDLDYPLQFDVTYPLKHSRLLAFLRITGIGIFVPALPHIMVASALTLTIPVVYLAGQISVLIMGRWPHYLFEYTISLFRYNTRLMAFLTGLTDTYPPFRL